MGGFTRIGKGVKKVAPKPPASKTLVRYCRCGHSKHQHELRPGAPDFGEMAGLACLICDCADYRFGSKRGS